LPLASTSQHPSPAARRPTPTVLAPILVPAPAAALFMRELNKMGLRMSDSVILHRDME